MERQEYEKMFGFENDYWWYRGLHELVIGFIERECRDRPLTILDAGCGTGRMAELLQRFGRVEAIDFSPDAVELARKRGLTDCSVQDLNEWQPEIETYHVIVCLDVIYADGIRDDAAILKKFFSALKPEGILVLNLPAFPILRRNHDVAVSGIRRYRKKKTAGLLKAMGYDLIHIGYRLPGLFFVMLLKRIFEKIVSAKKIESDLKPLPSWINRSLYIGHKLENRLIWSGIRFPLGGSLLIVARKPFSH